MLRRTHPEALQKVWLYFKENVKLYPRLAEKEPLTLWEMAQTSAHADAMVDTIAFYYSII